MSWKLTAGSAAAFLFLSVIVSGDSNRPEVVTNPPPAVNATMTWMPDSSAWLVEGKVKPSYRGFGGNVRLVCLPYATLTGGGGLEAGAASVDACGNFAFSIFTPVGGPNQLAPTFVCMFVVHVDATSQPQLCSGKTSLPDAPADPNGTAPCSGGYCPTAP